MEIMMMVDDLKQEASQKTGVTTYTLIIRPATISPTLNGQMILTSTTGFPGLKIGQQFPFMVPVTAAA